MDGRRSGSVERKAVYVKDERQANAGQVVEAVLATVTATAGVGVRQAGLDVASRRWRELGSAGTGEREG